MSENRHYPRLCLLLPSKVRVLECEVQGVSINDIRFSSREAFPPDSVKEMTLDTGEDEELKVQAAIRWCRPASSGGHEVGTEISVPAS